MYIKTSITLSEYLLKAIDTMIDEYGNRSRVIEEALKEFITHKNRQLRNLKDLELINTNADLLNDEAKDTLSYQVKM
jgi:metal-responsive CopG/Arc/MetJ family transcriptional regulator